MLENNSLLDVTSLSVCFPTMVGKIAAVDDVTFSIAPGETVAIVGESGSGKSTTAKALLGFLPQTADVTGSVKLRGQELLGTTDRFMRRFRGARIAYVPQNPFSSLNPAHKIGDQIAEAVKRHDPTLTKHQVQRRCLELLTDVGIDDPATRANAYPHEISGGMRQRVIIAMALAFEAELIIADEPTSALDVTVQAQILTSLESVRTRLNAALLFITHDLGVVARWAERVLVMYGGSIVEAGTAEDVLLHSKMPYTKGLIGAVPRTDMLTAQRLIKMPSNDENAAGGCPFAPRCPLVVPQCRAEKPMLIEHGESGHRIACHRADDAIMSQDASEIFPTTQESHTPTTRDLEEGDRLLTVSGLQKHFPITSRRNLFSSVTRELHAVCDVSLTLHRGETLAVVGESGSGKSTLNRCIVRLDEPDKGSILFRGTDLATVSSRAMRSRRGAIQMVLQDAGGMLNPKMSVGALLREPSHIHGIKDSQRADELLALVGLSPDLASRFPEEISGGQRQRVAIARALAVRPELLILDESVSALDVSVQADVLDLLKTLQRKVAVSFLFTTHNLGVAAFLADQIVVMYLGRIIEAGTTAEILGNPQHPYTRALLSAVPLPDPVEDRKRERIVLSGDIPSAVNPPSGCRFRTRCPVFPILTADVQERCISEVPALIHHHSGARTACHAVESGDVERHFSMPLESARPADD